MTKVPVPADKYVLYAAEDDLALRADPSVGGFLWKRMVLGTELICLEPKATAKAKIGVNGQWINVQDPDGDQGYVAAWFVSDTKGTACGACAAGNCFHRQTCNTATPAAAKLPPGALAFVPLEELSLRSQPVIDPATLIRRVPMTEKLVCVEPANQAIPKVGVTRSMAQSARCIQQGRLCGGMVCQICKRLTAPATTATTAAAAPVNGGPLKVKATAEGDRTSQATCCQRCNLDQTSASWHGICGHRAQCRGQSWQERSVAQS